MANNLLHLAAGERLNQFRVACEEGNVDIVSKLLADGINRDYPLNQVQLLFFIMLFYIRNYYY